MSIANIEKVLKLVDDTDRQEGMVAYPRYHQSMRDLAFHYGFGFVQTVAAFAALSPNNDYIGNLRSLVSVMVGIKNFCPPDMITTSTYGHCRDRAYAYLTGEKDFLMETEGPKTRAFYHNIVRPTCPKYVTIDGHMYGLWHGRRIVMKDVAHLKIPYSRIAKDFKTVARAHDLLPNQLQAMLWFTWKRIHKVVYKPQLSLFTDEDNRWGNAINVLDIRPFA